MAKQGRNLSYPQSQPYNIFKYYVFFACLAAWRDLQKMMLQNRFSRKGAKNAKIFISLRFSLFFACFAAWRDPIREPLKTCFTQRRKGAKFLFFLVYYPLLHLWRLGLSNKKTSNTGFHVKIHAAQALALRAKNAKIFISLRFSLFFTCFAAWRDLQKMMLQNRFSRKVAKNAKLFIFLILFFSFSFFEALREGEERRSLKNEKTANIMTPMKHPGTRKKGLTP